MQILCHEQGDCKNIVIVDNNASIYLLIWFYKVVIPLDNTGEMVLHEADSALHSDLAHQFCHKRSRVFVGRGGGRRYCFAKDQSTGGERYRVTLRCGQHDQTGESGVI